MPIETDEPVLDKERLLDVVHYICSKCDPAELGNVKLHKVLYFADMLHFVGTGRALTGGEYQKQRFGPCARHLTWAICQLRDNGRLEVRQRDFHGFIKMDYIGRGEVRYVPLGNYVIPLLNDVIDFVCRHSAKEISELSHNAAWEAVKLGDRIPYFTAYWMQLPEVTDEDVAAAEVELRSIPEFA